MIPVQFKEQNVTFAEHQQEYLPLPACLVGDAFGQVISCWRLGFIERLRVLLFGRLWLRQYTFGDKLQPQLPQIESPFES